MSAKVNEFHVSLVGKKLILHLIFGQQLTAFNELMAYTASSCVARLRQIKRVKHCCDKQTLITLIDALVFSKFFLLFACLE